MIEVRETNTSFYERNKLAVILEGYSVPEIAQMLKKDEYDVSDAVTAICMARENYRMNYL